MDRIPIRLWTAAALLVALASMLSQPVWAEPGVWNVPPEFVAQYELRILGVRVGELTVSLTSDSGNEHDLVAEVEAAKPLQLLIPATSSLSSRLDSSDGQLRPLVFTRRTGNGAKATEDRSIFDWSSATVTTYSDGTKHSTPLSDRTFDSASIYFAIMLDQSSGTATRDYSVWDGTRLQHYRTTAGEVDAIDTPLGTIEAVLVERQRIGGKSLTRLWLAPELHYLPVQIAHVKGKRERFRVALTSVTGLGSIPVKAGRTSPHP